MMDWFYGKTAFAILLTAILTGAALFTTAAARSSNRPQLVYATFSKEHAVAYRAVIGEFERKHNVSVQFQVVDQRALQGRLQSALQVGAAVPDMVELLDGTMGIFTKGALADVKFLDLTDRLHSTGLYNQLVTTRFPKWSSRGRIFALPHDVHPVMLCYRRDLVEQLGIDVKKLTTWEEFCRVGREVVTKDLDGDGTPDRYMIDLPTDGGDALRLFLLQRGGNSFTSTGDVAFDSEEAVDVLCWYVKQIQGDGRIAFPCGWGQTLAKSLIDGLCLFYLCPDWRTDQFEQDVPSLNGKLALMPLPAWTPGGLRTSTWGGTGLAITTYCKNPDLAWELANYLYYDRQQLGPRFADTNILPPLIASWQDKEFTAPNAFYSNIPLGTAYAELAKNLPKENDSPYMFQARDKFSEAFANASLYYRTRGEAGLREYTRAELKRCADRVRTMMNRNVFLNPTTTRPKVASVAAAAGGSQ